MPSSRNVRVHGKVKTEMANKRRATRPDARCEKKCGNSKRRSARTAWKYAAEGALGKYMPIRMYPSQVENVAAPLRRVRENENR